jgi:transcriptional regulator with XRE-family HTH domain
MRPYLRLTHERHARGWTQATVGELAGRSGLHRALTQSEVSAIELGRINPTPDELDAFGRVFGISPASVLLKPCAIANPEDLEPAEAVESQA